MLGRFGIATQGDAQERNLTVLVLLLAVGLQGSSTAMRLIVREDLLVLEGKDTRLGQTKDRPHHLLQHVATTTLEVLLALTQRPLDALLPVVAHRVDDHLQATVEITSETTLSCGLWFFWEHCILWISSGAREDGHVVRQVIGHPPIQSPTEELVTGITWKLIQVSKNAIKNLLNIPITPTVIQQAPEKLLPSGKTRKRRFRERILSVVEDTSVALLARTAIAHKVRV